MFWFAVKPTNWGDKNTTSSVINVVSLHLIENSSSFKISIYWEAIISSQQTVKAHGIPGFYCQLILLWLLYGETPAGVTCKVQPLQVLTSIPCPLSPTAKVKALRPSIVHREEERRGGGGGRLTKENTQHDVDKLTQFDKRPEENM